MHNTFIRERTAEDIDQRIAKILNDLGDPQPPLRLEIVRELLRLDLAYYSASDTGILTETIHRLKVGGKQVVKRPGLLLDAVKKWDLKALWVPDRKRILIDSELPSAKQRWGEAHEIGHSILPWHEIVMHGDMKRTLSLDCEQQIENEANYAAGRLLFLQDAFVEHLNGSEMSFEHVKSLSRTFGNTMTSTLWRAVESCNDIAFGLVSQHPRHAPKETPLRYFVRSRSFCQAFENVAAMEVFQGLKAFCHGNRGPIGTGELILVDSNGRQHVFHAEAFFNAYDTLTLGIHKKPRATSLKV